jgi:hypothetical protein
VCNCKAEFELKAIIPRIQPITKREKQRLYFEAMFSEFEKVLKNNIVDVSKIASLDSHGSLEFSKASKHCVFKDPRSFSSNCASPRARELLADEKFMKSYNERVTNEVLNLLGPISESPRLGLLERANRFSNFSSNQCSVTEQEAMRNSSIAIEHLIAPSLFEAITNIRSSLGGKTIDEIMDSSGFDPSIVPLLLQHPLISVHLKDGAQFLRFIDSIPAPKSLGSLQNKLMSAETSSIVDAKLAESCATSFTNFRAAICSNKFEEGDLELDPFANLANMGIEKPNDLPTIASDEELIEFNKKVLAFCPGERNSNSQQLNTSLGSIAEFLPSTYQGLSNKKFSEDKYLREISSARDQICSNLNQTQNCNTKTNLIEKHGCLAAQLWLESKNSPAPTLAQISNRPVMNLLRNLLPPLEEHSPETKQALARIGIIPTSQAQRPTGAQVAQAAAEVERFNPNFTSAANATLPRTRNQSPVVTTVADVPVESRVQAAGGQRPAYSAQLAEVMSQKQRMFEESNETYRSVIDELMKRRMDNPSRQEVTEAVTEEFRRSSKPFDPRSREGQSFINNIVNNYPRAVASNNPQAITRPFEQERVAQAFEEAVTATNSSPVTSAGRSIAGSDVNSIAASARLSSAPSSNGVAKVVVTDPKLNLTDPALPQLLQSVLTLNENGEVLQSMLDQRKDFILKLNSTEVMMDFDPEAQNYRIRPLGNVPTEVIASLNRFLNDYSLIARVRGQRHSTLNALVQELQQSQSSL